MTIENSIYGVNWVKCGRCGTTQPIATLVDANKGAVWSCIDETRCCPTCGAPVSPLPSTPQLPIKAPAMDEPKPLAPYTTHPPAGRVGWTWCADCAGIQPPLHRHGVAVTTEQAAAAHHSLRAALGLAPMGSDARARWGTLAAGRRRSA